MKRDQRVWKWNGYRRFVVRLWVGVDDSERHRTDRRKKKKKKLRSYRKGLSRWGVGNDLRLEGGAIAMWVAMVTAPSLGLPLLLVGGGESPARRLLLLPTVRPSSSTPSINLGSICYFMSGKFGRYFSLTMES